VSPASTLKEEKGEPWSLSKPKTGRNDGRPREQEDQALIGLNWVQAPATNLDLDSIAR
jgi:hypothetical protein